MPNGFQVTTKRIDPYKTYKFQLKRDGKTVLGVMKASMLKRTTNVITHRSGGENSVDHKTPGRTTYDAVTLERGITWDDLDFENWANKVHPYAGDAGMDLVNFRKECALEVLNEKGRGTSGLAIMTVLSLLVGAFVVSVAAALGGQQRDEHV